MVPFVGWKDLLMGLLSPRYYIGPMRFRLWLTLSIFRRYWKEFITWGFMVVVLYAVLSQKIVWAVEQTVMWKEVFLPTVQTISPVVGIIITHYFLGKKIDAVKTAVDNLTGRLSVHQSDDCDGDCDNDCPNNPHKKDRANMFSDIIGFAGMILAALNAVFFMFLFLVETRLMLSQWQILLGASAILLLPALSGVLSFLYRRTSLILAFLFVSLATIPWILIFAFFLTLRPI